MLERLWYWLLTPSETPSKPPSAPTETAESESAADIATLQELAARVRQLEAQSSLLQLDWQETLDKLGRWASKQSARERRRVDRDLGELAGDGPIPAEDGAGATNGGGAGSEGPPLDAQAARAHQKSQLRARARALNLRG